MQGRLIVHKKDKAPSFVNFDDLQVVGSNGRQDQSVSWAFDSSLFDRRMRSDYHFGMVNMGTSDDDQLDTVVDAGQRYQAAEETSILHQDSVGHESPGGSIIQCSINGQVYNNPSFSPKYRPNQQPVIIQTSNPSRGRQDTNAEATMVSVEHLSPKALVTKDVFCSPRSDQEFSDLHQSEQKLVRNAFRDYDQYNNRHEVDNTEHTNSSNQQRTAEIDQNQKSESLSISPNFNGRNN